MFGILAPCRHTLDADLADQWRAHLCGLCLSLRDNHGQATRLTTNTDAVMVSVLLAAQRAESPVSARAGRCPLRGMQSADVVVADDPGIRLATTASLTLAAGKAYDTVGEQTSGLAAPSRSRRMIARHLGGRLRAGAAADTVVADVVGVDDILLRLSRQHVVETQSAGLDELTRASAEAAAAVFASAADLAGADQNRNTLAAMGFDFGRVAHLMDAIDDLDDDRRSGSFNPLDATGTTVAAALADCRRLVSAIRRRYDTLALHDDRLLRAVLLDGLTHAVSRRTPNHGRCGGHRTQARQPVIWPRQRPPDFPTNWPYPPPFQPNRQLHQRLLPFAGVACTGRACCVDHWNHCSDKWKSPVCDANTCDNCDDCCDCCDCFN